MTDMIDHTTIFPNETTENPNFSIRTVYVEITNQCNLNCRTCYNRSGLNRTRKELSVEQLEGILRLFAGYGIKRFLLSGGEPTLHTEFDRILDLVDKYPEISFGIVTNGTNHHPRLIEYLNSKDNFTLQITLDGSCEELNAKTRGAGHFERTMEFARQIHKTNPKPLLKMVISQHNYTDVENFCQLAHSIGFVPELAFIYKSGNGSDDWDSKVITAQQKLKILRMVQQMNAEQNADIFLPLCTSRCSFLGELKDLSLCVKVDGTIQPCQGLYDERYAIGNALSFDTHTFTTGLNRIVDLARQRAARMDYGCEKCIINKACGRGCMAMALNLHDDPLADDGDCEYRKLQFLHHFYPSRLYY